MTQIKSNFLQFSILFQEIIKNWGNFFIVLIKNDIKNTIESQYLVKILFIFLEEKLLNKQEWEKKEKEWKYNWDKSNFRICSLEKYSILIIN